MKILLLAPHAYYIDRGTPIDIDLLLRAMSLRGDAVDAVVYSEGEDRSYPGVSVHRIPGPRGERPIRPGFSLRKIAYDIRLFLLARKLIRRGGHDVVHASEEAVFMALVFRWLYGVPYVYDMDSSIAQQMVEQMPFLKALAWFFNWLEALALGHAIAAAPVCNALADLAYTRGAKHVFKLYDISQLDPEDFQSSGEVRERLGLNGIVLMYVGNFQPYQGVGLLLSAFREVLARGVDMDLVLAGGSDKDIASHRARARALGCEERTHFLGHWPVSRLGALLAEADILAVPRIKGLNTPMKVFPFMHSGRPVVATALPTHTQILDDSVAMLAPPDPNGFGAAIIRLAEDPDLRARLGEAGRDFVEKNHTWKAHVGRVNQLYDFLDHTLSSGVAESSSEAHAGRKGS